MIHDCQADRLGAFKEHRSESLLRPVQAHLHDSNIPNTYKDLKCGIKARDNSHTDSSFHHRVIHPEHTDTRFSQDWEAAVDSAYAEGDNGEVDTQEPEQPATNDSWIFPGDDELYSASPLPSPTTETSARYDFSAGPSLTSSTERRCSVSGRSSVYSQETNEIAFLDTDSSKCKNLPVADLSAFSSSTQSRHDQLPPVEILASPFGSTRLPPADPAECSPRSVTNCSTILFTGKETDEARVAYNSDHKHDLHVAEQYVFQTETPAAEDNQQTSKHCRFAKASQREPSTQTGTFESSSQTEEKGTKAIVGSPSLQPLPLKLHRHESKPSHNETQRGYQPLQDLTQEISNELRCFREEEVASNCGKADAVTAALTLKNGENMHKKLLQQIIPLQQQDLRTLRLVRARRNTSSSIPSVSMSERNQIASDLKTISPHISNTPFRPSVEIGTLPNHRSNSSQATASDSRSSSSMTKFMRSDGWTEISASPPCLDKYVPFVDRSNTPSLPRHPAHPSLSGTQRRPSQEAEKARTVRLHGKTGGLDGPPVPLRSYGRRSSEASRDGSIGKTSIYRPPTRPTIKCHAQKGVATFDRHDFTDTSLILSRPHAPVSMANVTEDLARAKFTNATSAIGNEESFRAPFDEPISTRSDFSLSKARQAIATPPPKDGFATAPATSTLFGSLFRKKSRSDIRPDILPDTPKTPKIPKTPKTPKTPTPAVPAGAWRPFDEPQDGPPCTSSWLFGGQEDRLERNLRKQFFKEKVEKEESERKEEQRRKLEEELRIKKLLDEQDLKRRLEYLSRPHDPPTKEEIRRMEKAGIKYREPIIGYLPVPNPADALETPKSLWEKKHGREGADENIKETEDGKPLWNT